MILNVKTFLSFTLFSRRTISSSLSSSKRKKGKKRLPSHVCLSVPIMASYIFPLSVLRVSMKINQAALSNSATLEFHFPKDNWLMQGHILLTRHYSADGYDGHGFNKRSVSWALGGTCVFMCKCLVLWYPQMGFGCLIATCYGFAEIWERLDFSYTPMSFHVFPDIIGHFSSSTGWCQRCTNWGQWRKKNTVA